MIYWHRDNICGALMESNVKLAFTASLWMVGAIPIEPDEHLESILKLAFTSVDYAVGHAIMSQSPCFLL